MGGIKKALAICFAASMCLIFSACGKTEEGKISASHFQAESSKGKSRADKSAEAASSLKSWEEGGAKERIVKFVEDATDRVSMGYIPPENRIAVTDIDGTLIAEKGRKVDNKAMVRKTPAEARAYLQEIQERYFDKDKELRYGGILYQPMAEMYDYLEANGFEIFFVSGNCNALTYAWANYYFGADYAHCIGSNVELEIDDSQDFRMEPTGKYEGCWKEKKCYRIYNQVGKCPVLAFGNSDGDVRMLQWTQANPDYSGLGVMIVHDDRREYVYSVDLISRFCQNNHFVKAEISRSFKKIFIEK